MWEAYVNMIIFLGGSLVAGVILQKWVIARLRKIAGRTSWKWDDIWIDALGIMPIVWCLCCGVYAVLATSRLDPDTYRFALKLLITLVILTVTVVFARMARNSVKSISDTTEAGVSSTTLLINRPTGKISYHGKTQY